MSRALVCGMLALFMAGYKADCSSTAAPLTPISESNRKIEVAVRSQFNLPYDVEISIGTAIKSASPGYEIPGYQELPITFTKGGKATTINFLLSDDGNTIARLEKIDLSHNPADMISTQNRPVRGNPAAKVTVVTFDDLECPYCAQMHMNLFPQTADRYQGLVRFIYKDYPLKSHPWAMHAAVNANCLASQSGDAYWIFVDYVHSHAHDIGGQQLDMQAAIKTLDTLAHDDGQRWKLDLVKLDGCIAKQDESGIEASIQQGNSVGVNLIGTPTLFVNGERVYGIKPGPALWVVIDRALREAGIQPPPEPAQSMNRQSMSQEGTPPAVQRQ